MVRRKEAFHAARVAVFTRVFEACRTGLREHVACFIDDEVDVADIVSDVFALAWAKLDHAKPLGMVWLLRAADNKIKDRERSLRVRARFLGEMRSAWRFPCAEDILDKIAVRRAMTALLTPREKQVVTLFYWDRLAAGEIAELLSCSQATIFTTLSRARRKLARELRPDDPAEPESGRRLALSHGINSL